jgi:hypothetical protein
VSSQARPDSPATRSGSAASSVCSSAEGSTTVVVGPAGAVTGKIYPKGTNNLKLTPWRKLREAEIHNGIEWFKGRVLI